MTYPVFVPGPGGSLLFFYRDGSSDLESVLLNRLDPKKQRWQRVATVLDGRPSNESPYVQHVVSDGRGGIDLMVLHVWHTGVAWRMDEVDLGATLAGRPALLNDGAGDIQVLWAARESSSLSSIRLTPLHPVPSQVSRRLATVPLGDWEPTFDSSALACCSRLHLLLPTTATLAGVWTSGTAAVATYDLRAALTNEATAAA